MRLGFLALLPHGCIIFDTSPGDSRLAELTDADADGSTLAEGDCNDADPRIYPGAPEVCDGLDNDCDEASDEDGGEVQWCLDGDGDGHGDAATMNDACVVPTDGVTICDDCLDADRRVYPMAEEKCDGVDNNCDLMIDDTGSSDAATWYRDADADGFGVEEMTAASCTTPDGYAAQAGDCDDSDSRVNPGMTEVCNNGLDDDCDQSVGGCGFSGLELLEPHGVSGVAGGFVAGPVGTTEGLGRETHVLDVTADGLSDLVLCGSAGMYGQSFGGSVHLWYGTPVGYQEITGAGAHLYGPAGLGLGYDFGVLATDVDGDGDPELLLGALGQVAGFSQAGQILVFEPGLSGTREVLPSDIWVAGIADGEQFGADLQRADGLVEVGEYILVGADGYSDTGAYAGKVYILDLADPRATSAAAVIVGTEPGDGIGYHEPPLIDLDGDGFDDIVFGTSLRNAGGGAVMLFHGPLRGEYLLDDADTVISEADIPYLGSSSTTVVDSDGAGTGGLIVTSAGVSDTALDGAVYVLPGSVSGSVTLSEVALATVAGEVHLGGPYLRLDRGDLDGDGSEDLLVGDPGYSTKDSSDVGAVYLIADPLTLTGTLDIVEASQARFYGRSPADQLGAALAIGDANHDGRNDLLFSGNNVDLGWQPGGAYFLLGEGM